MKYRSRCWKEKPSYLKAWKMSCSEKLKTELARNALMECFSTGSIYLSNWNSAGRNQFSYFWFWNVSSGFKVVKTSCFKFLKWKKKKLQSSVLKAFLSKCNLIMPAISKVSWKYCKWPQIELLFVFFFFYLFISDRSSTFSRILLFVRLREWKNILSSLIEIQLVQFMIKVPSVGHTSVSIY